MHSTLSLTFVLPHHICKLRTFIFLHSVTLHGYSHIIDLILPKRVVHQLQVVFRPDLIVDKQTDVECPIFHVISFPIDQSRHPLHKYLQSVRINLGQISSYIADDPT